jgi:hypothetical protein
MRYFNGEEAADWSEAVPLALDEARKEELSPETAKLFLTTLDQKRLQAETDKSIQSAIRQKYGSQARWSGPRWFIPVVEPRFENVPAPQIIFTVQTYLVAALVVKTPDYVYHRTLVGTAGKLEKLHLPLTFLEGILNDDYETKFRVMGKDSLMTGWLIPGFKDSLWLADAFVVRLRAVLRRQSVAGWLLDFGTGGRKIIPLVAGTLIGWLLAGKKEAVLILDRPWDRETVIQKLTQMYGSAVAAGKFQKKAHLLTVAMTNNQALNVLLGGD